jgi:hypothetical protein
VRHRASCESCLPADESNVARVLLISKIPALAPGVAQAGRKSGTNVEVGRHASALEQEDAKTTHASLDQR